ncbi:hypothetical protein SBDP1_1580004 [Syntrophobacter sp. SbD1]|nr:hypothetical protein SBDP1_1580004 [Syntrophobacter sp. SbD1]
MAYIAQAEKIIATRFGYGQEVSARSPDFIDPYLNLDLTRL